MLGVYDYTVWMTYISALSAVIGIAATLGGGGHPFAGMFFLVFSGLLDAFDGIVARTKKDRTDKEKKFGIQIDSLSDLLAFGALPAAIGYALVRKSTFFSEKLHIFDGTFIGNSIALMIYLVLLWYMLTALIRLAYFNITEDERQAVETSKRKYYVGLPVTSSAVIMPMILALDYFFSKDMTAVYIAFTAIMAFAFVSDFKVKKPGIKGIIIIAAAAVVIVFLTVMIKLIFD